MKLNQPISFKIFIVVISIVIIAYTLASIFSFYQVDKKYAMIVALLLFISMTFTTVGIYTGFTNKSNERKFKLLNSIGLIGNLTIILLIIGLMTYAAIAA